MSWKTFIKLAEHQLFWGNLAPEGSVAKITGKEGLKFEGPAKCFDCEEDMLHALEEGKIQKGDVVIIRYEGPKGGPGMPEMCKYYHTNSCTYLLSIFFLALKITWHIDIILNFHLTNWTWMNLF